MSTRARAYTACTGAGAPILLRARPDKSLPYEYSLLRNYCETKCPSARQVRSRAGLNSSQSRSAHSDGVASACEARGRRLRKSARGRARRARARAWRIRTRALAPGLSTCMITAMYTLRSMDGSSWARSASLLMCFDRCPKGTCRWKRRPVRAARVCAWHFGPAANFGFKIVNALT